MTFYCYALYDYSLSDFGLIQSHVNDDVAAYEFARQILREVTDQNFLNLTVVSPDNPFVWDNGSFKLSDDFLKRYSIYRLGIYDSSTGLLDGSVDRVDLGDKFREAFQAYLDYYNKLDYFKNLEEVKENES